MTELTIALLLGCLAGICIGAVAVLVMLSLSDGAIERLTKG